MHIERRGAVAREVIHFGPRVGAAERYIDNGNDFLFLPGGPADGSWRHRDHSVALDGFGDDLRRRHERDLRAQLTRFGAVWHGHAP